MKDAFGKILVSVLLCAFYVLQAEAGPPNIIMIFGDDMAWYDTPVRMDDRMSNSAQDALRRLEINGQPYEWNLEKIANAGMIFRNAYAGAPQCCPSRGTLQTGQSTARNHVGVTTSTTQNPSDRISSGYDKYPVKPNKIFLPFPSSMVTIPEALAPFGYQCAHYGKWHLATDPAVEGYADSDYAEIGYADGNGPGSTLQPGETIDTKVDLDPKRMERITDLAIGFMTNQVAAGNPFYIQLSHYVAHAGHECYPASRDLFLSDPDVSSASIAIVLGMIYDLDQTIGRLLQKVDDLGLTTNTYVLFMSDNGFRRTIGNFKHPLYGKKWMLWQSGIRVPLMIKGPGIPTNQVSTANVVNYDLMPTFYEWAGGNPADLQNVDGVSLKGLLEGETPTEAFLDRSLYFHYPYYRNSQPMSAIVKGKYKLAHSYDGVVRRDPATKKSIMDNPDMLFDLSVDPGEFHNINTSPTNSPLAAALRADLDSYLASVDAWMPQDNASNYLADIAASDASFADADTNNDFYAEFEDFAKRDTLRKWPGRFIFPPFEGTRTNSALFSLNDADKSPIDYWFDVHGVDIGDNMNDYDSDGLINLVEYLLGTDPADPSSGRDFLPSMVYDGVKWAYTFHPRSIPGDVKWTVEMTENLQGAWGQDGLDVEEIGTGGDFNQVSVSPSNAPSAAFFRIHVEH